MFKNKNAIIFGKGPSFRSDIIKNSDDLFITINEATNYIESPDILVINDWEKSQNIDKYKISLLRLIVLPYNPHVSYKPNYNYTWENVKNSKLYEEFKGDWYVYNLKSSRRYVDIFPKFDSYLTSANTAVEWCSLNGINNIITYGIGLDRGYNISFDQLVNTYNPLDVRNEIINRCNKYKIKIEFK